MPTTAIWQEFEFCGKYTLALRKKFYLNRKNSVRKFANSRCREPYVGSNFKQTL